MANKQPAVTEQTKNNLRRAFGGSTSKSPRKITVKQITDLAGYNRGTFYLYFKDVYDLLEDIEAKMLQVIEDLMNNLTSTYSGLQRGVRAEGEGAGRARCQHGPQRAVPLQHALRRHARLRRDHGEPGAGGAHL